MEKPMKQSEVGLDVLVMCKCGKNPVEPAHSCPFQSEIHNDDEFQCTCCPDCTQECCDEI